MPTGGLLYAEDLAEGMTVALGSRTVSRDEIVDFAREWDPLPFHVDEGAASRSPFGGIIASGIHTVAIAGNMLSEGMVRRTAIIAGRGMKELHLPIPVRPGQTLTGALTVVETQIRGDGTAACTWRVELTNERGEVVLSMLADIRVRSRADSPPEPARA